MSRLRALFPAVALVAAVLGVALAVNGADADPVIQAQVVDLETTSVESSFQTIDFGTTTSADDDRTGKTKWRVVAGTGNCCENYLTSTASGRIYDFGGTYINFSDDKGLTWKQVQPLTPLVTGEGTIVLAPNGDVLGIGWDPYSGDHLQAFKYEAHSGKWFYNELPLHTPFYDREWITLVPGPFSVDGQTVPYITFLKGGYPSKELYLWSSDGLNYLEASSKFVDSSNNSTVSEWLTTKADKSFDWIQPNSGSGLTPLGGGAVLASPDYVPIGVPGAGGAPEDSATSDAAPRATSFSGAVTGPDGSCDTDKGPWIVEPGEDVDSVSVEVAAELTANDSVIHLKRNGVVVASQDSATSPEVIVYDPPGAIEVGGYTVQVCDFLGGGEWLAPNGYFGLITFNPVGANATPESRWALLDPTTLTWSGYRYGDESLPQGLHQIDGKGRVHNLLPNGTSFDYRISPDGGQTWNTVNVPLPEGLSIEQIDFRANRAAGVAAVLMRADKAADDTDQDLVYKLDLKTDTPFVKRLYYVGLGDAGATSGVGNDVRMDFQTVTILKNGALAVSFLDSTTGGAPSVAIELSTKLPRR